MKRSGKQYETGMMSDLPRPAEAEVALHLFDRRGDPSFEEGILTSLQTIPPKTRPHRVSYQIFRAKLGSVQNWRDSRHVSSNVGNSSEDAEGVVKERRRGHALILRPSNEPVSVGAVFPVAPSRIRFKALNTV